MSFRRNSLDGNLTQQTSAGEMLSAICAMYFSHSKMYEMVHLVHFGVGEVQGLLIGPQGSPGHRHHETLRPGRERRAHEHRQGKRLGEC